MQQISPREHTGFKIKIETGATIEIPVSRADDFEYFRLDQAEEIRRYYDEFGYVVIRNLIPKELCQRARASFDQEVRPYNGFIYRQTTCSPERHVFSRDGFMMNSILNVQSVHPGHLGAFRQSGLDVITHTNLQQAVRDLFRGEPGKLVQSMFFDGNPVTGAHQDTYYLDAEEIGRMTAVWIAAEDIGAGAGRFFIYPRSHLVDMPKNGGDQDVGFNHAVYKKRVLEVIERHKLECRAPALAEGDGLFWAAKTIHGSLPTVQPRVSRRSFTAHFIPQSSRFLQFQTRVRPLNLRNVNGLAVHHPKDLSRASARSVLWVESTFPKSFRTAKKIATKLILR